MQKKSRFAAALKSNREASNRAALPLRIQVTG
ncbi:protein of unknown function [Hyphomicrobium sp. 1Nfss2.1]